MYGLGSTANIVMDFVHSCPRVVAVERAIVARSPLLAMDDKVKLVLAKFFYVWQNLRGFRDRDATTFKKIILTINYDEGPSDNFVRSRIARKSRRAKRREKRNAARNGAGDDAQSIASNATSESTVANASEDVNEMHGGTPECRSTSRTLFVNIFR